MLWTPEILTFFAIPSEQLKRQFETERESFTRLKEQQLEGNKRKTMDQSWRRESYVDLKELEADIEEEVGSSKK